MATTPLTHIDWTESGTPHRATWRAEGSAAPPARVHVVDDALTADAAHRLASEGTGLLWRGDFQNARQLLQAMARRIDRPPRSASKKARERQARADEAKDSPPAHAFHLHRQAQAQRARTLGRVLIELQADDTIALRRAPDWRAAIAEAWGEPAARDAGDAPATTVVSLRELLGLVGAHEWRKKGVEIAALGAPPGNRIHPHYGVFSPVRGEYLDLVAQAPLPAALAHESLAFDIGTGTGVIAAVLARRGVARIVATDQDPRALACARENLARLQVDGAAQLLQADLFPPGRAPLIVCNPPWLPGRASSPIEHAIYDEGSRMLRGFLGGLAAHLAEGGEGWLVMSDLAEHLGLRVPGELQGWIDAAGLRVVARHDTRPRHGKAQDANDPLHAARSREITSLWRLAMR